MTSLMPPFRVEPGEPPEPDTILDANNRPLSAQEACDRLNASPRPAEDWMREAAEKIANATQWTKPELEALIAQDHYEVNGLKSVHSETVQSLARALLASMGECDAATTAAEVHLRRAESVEAKLREIAGIASWEERDKDAYIEQGPGILIRDMRRILSIARNP